ncbi:MAG: hypothetical protein K0Q99_1337 [Clostridia bacterium]|jgi:hypothetical protein|nr:hypothetical protein [Clostridia bacterium]
MDTIVNQKERLIAAIESLLIFLKQMYLEINNPNALNFDIIHIIRYK